MPVDNDLYNRIGDTWWDDANPLSFLLTGLNPGRLGYFREVLTERLGVDPHGSTLLDIGCGGGFLAEEFARLGFRVTGVDPSPRSLATAQAHVEASGLEIEYRQGKGEALPAEPQSMDVVSCCDVLEHVADLNRVIAEIARVLKPNGVFLYDTVNRTAASWLVVIKVVQDWKPTRIFPTDLHDWRMFITPDQLRGLLARHALENGEIVGLRPGGSLISLARDYLATARGRITPGELGRRHPATPSKDTRVSYMGYAVKR